MRSFLSAEFYLDEATAPEAARSECRFNLIDLARGLEGDFVGSSTWTRLADARNRERAAPTSKPGPGSNPRPWASISPSIVHSSLNGPGGQELFNGYILRTRADLQFTRELFLRIVVQYDDFGSALSVGRSSPTGRTRSP